MRRKVRLTESDLHKIVRQSVKRVLREKYELDSQIEEFDGFDNDLEYESIREQAYYFIYKHPELCEQDAIVIAEKMGFHMDSIGPNDYKTLRKAIDAAKEDIFWDEQ